LDWRVEDAGCIQRLEFTLQGFDEENPVSGRGCATIPGPEMTGQVYFHRGDKSGFIAIREKKHRASRRPTGKVIRLPIGWLKDFACHA
jgi:hypothetical protein